MAQYRLHAPFVITPRLAVGLRIGGAWLSLMSTAVMKEGATPLGPRQCASMVLDLPDGTEYADDTLQSGCGGFGGVVTIFETYLSFLLAAVESYEFEQRNPGRKGESTELFPAHVLEWAAENKNDIEACRLDLIADLAIGEVDETLVEVLQ